MAEVWNVPTNACDACGIFVAWTTVEREDAIYEKSTRDAPAKKELELPNRPHSRACPRYAHRWYLCPQCPEMDFCGACAVKHEHACCEGGLHDDTDMCVLCYDSIDKLSEYHMGWSRPCPPPRPHPDHPAADPPLFVEYFTHVNPGPHYDSDDAGSGESDDDYAYTVYYPGPYKDENNKQRRYVSPR